MTQNAALQEEVLPAGGIADFIMDDAEIEALEKQETIEAFGDQGIANFNGIARRMASYGRYGDDTVAHVETGELVIPKALIQGNDKLKESIFDHLRELGVEDPERYIVGSGENSINPETGLPEFFFKKIFRAAKKAVSSVARAVKKTVKKIGKVIKKAAPILLTVGLSLAGVPPVFTGMLSGGIGTLIQGGSLKDAFKNAALGGAVAGIASGVSGGISGALDPNSTFLQGAKQGLARGVGYQLGPAGAIAGGSFAPLQQGFSNVGSALTGDFSKLSVGRLVPKFLEDTQLGDAASSVDKALGFQDTIGATTVPSAQQVQALDPTQAPTAAEQSRLFNVMQERAAAQNLVDAQFSPNFDSAAQIGGQAPLSTASSTTPTVAELRQYKTPSLTDSFKNLVTGEGGGRLQALENIFAPNTGAPTAADYFSADPSLGAKGSALLADSGKAGIIRTFGPATAAAGAAAYGLGFFDTPKPPSPEETAAEYRRYLIAAGYPEDYSTYFYNPDGTRTEEGKKYLVGGLQAPSVASVVGDQGLMGGFDAGAMAPARTFEDGGDVFPRRTGGIGPNEGTPNEDSVRAMLMPGEFVMTTDAVRGADPTGQGNLNNGISTMYDMMSNLEMRGRAAA